MVTMMMNVRKNWKKALLPFVHYGEDYKPIRTLQRLTNYDTAIIGIVQVYAEHQLPTIFAPRRCFDFLRFGKEIMKDVYVVVDVSSHYFSNSTLRCNSEKRPSGVIIREHGPQDCEIICVDHVEVDVETTENMYSSVTNSSLEFCAKRWISTLLSNLNRINSKFIDAQMDVHRKAGSYLLGITHYMKNFFMECVSQSPDEDLVSVLTSVEDPIRILQRVDSFGYVGVTSFRVQARPLSVFQFLMKKDLQLQFSRYGNAMTEQLFRFATDDESNTISLHRKKMKKESRFVLQEASRDDYYSFILSTALHDDDVNLHIVSGVVKEQLEGLTYDAATSGFCIMPNGSGGLQCNGSLVTFVKQLQCNGTTTFESIRESFAREKNTIIRELNEEAVSD